MITWGTADKYKKRGFLRRVYFIIFYCGRLSIQKKRKENTGCRCATNNDLWLCGKTWEELQENQLFQLLRRALYWFFSKIESEGESEASSPHNGAFQKQQWFLRSFLVIKAFHFQQFTWRRMDYVRARSHQHDKNRVESAHDRQMTILVIMLFFAALIPYALTARKYNFRCIWSKAIWDDVYKLHVHLKVLFELCMFSFSPQLTFMSI